MCHNTQPLLLHETLTFFIYNSYLILQKSSLTTEKIVQRKENFFLMRDYAQQRCNNILCHLFLSAIFSPLGMPHFTYTSCNSLDWEFGRPKSGEGLISALVIAGNGIGIEGSILLQGSWKWLMQWLTVTSKTKV